jgi:hypothetical protein
MAPVLQTTNQMKELTLANERGNLQMDKRIIKLCTELHAMGNKSHIKPLVNTGQDAEHTDMLSRPKHKKRGQIAGSQSA